MNAVGIDASKGKSMVAALRPRGEVALMPQEVLHTEVGLEQMAYAIIALGGDSISYSDVFGFLINRLSVRCSWRRRYCVPQRSCFFKNCSSAWLALISLDLLISSLSVIIAVNNQRYNCKSNKRIYIVLIIYKNVSIRRTKFRSIFCIFCRLTNYCYSWYAVNK